MYEIQTGSRNQTRAISMVPKNITLVSIDNMSRQKETLMGNIFGTYIRVDFKVPYIILYKLKVAYHVKRFFELILEPWWSLFLGSIFLNHLPKTRIPKSIQNVYEKQKNM